MLKFLCSTLIITLLSVYSVHAQNNRVVVVPLLGDGQDINQCQVTRECSNGEAILTCPSGDSVITCAPKRIFVTSSGFTGNLGGLNGADSICQGLANQAGLNGFFKAWLSDSTTDAVDRINGSDSGYVNFNGDPVADDLADLLSGNIDNPIMYDETGESRVDTVRTGTLSDGTRFLGSGGASQFCNDWTNAGVAPDVVSLTGISSQTGRLWTDATLRGCNNNDLFLYCVEQ